MILIKKIHQADRSELSCFEKRFFGLCSQNDVGKTKAFTLAEILITIGVIGIVASLTLSILIPKYQDMQYKAAYKKSFAQLNQALNKAKADDLLEEARTTSPDPTPFEKNFLVLMSEFKIVKKCVSSNNSQCWDPSGEKYGLKYSAGYPNQYSYAFIDNSGMAWTQYYGGALRVFVDTNGFKKPNRWGKDRFVFYIRDKNNQDEANMDVPQKVSACSDSMSIGCYNACYNNKCGADSSYFGLDWLYK